jgi:hypothetical protein
MVEGDNGGGNGVGLSATMLELHCVSMGSTPVNPEFCSAAFGTAADDVGVGMELSDDASVHAGTAGRAIELAEISLVLGLLIPLPIDVSLVWGMTPCMTGSGELLKDVDLSKCSSLAEFARVPSAIGFLSFVTKATRN